jgi:hypothetical protein
MYIPTGVILPCFLAAFVWLAYQYLVVNPDRRLLNVRFMLMIGAILLTLVYLMVGSLQTGIFPLVFLLLGLAWLGVAFVLQRFMPPPKY